MSARIRRWGGAFLKLAATAAVTAALLGRIGIGVDAVRELDPGMWRPEPLSFLAASSLLVVGYLVSSLLWSRMVRELGGVALAPRTAIRVHLLGNLGRYLPGKVWQLVGTAVLAARHGIPIAISTGGSLLTQLAALGAAGVLALPALLQEGGTFRSIGLALLAGIAAGLLLPLLRRPYEAVLRRLFSRFSLTPPAPLLLDRGFGIRWLLFFVGNWLFYAGAFAVLSRSLGWGGGGLLEIGSAYAAAYLLGYLAIFAPAGIGVREGVLVTLLQPALGSDALALAVVARLWTTLLELIPLLFVASWPGSGSGSREHREKSGHAR